MRSTRKALLMLIACAVLISASVFATVAYFTDEASVTNTFTVGKVHIRLDETQVSTDGVPVSPAARTESGNSYHLVPGKTYTKDPTLTVDQSSDAAYVRLKLSITCADELSAAFARHGSTPFAPELLLSGFDSSWRLHSSSYDAAANSFTYEYRYASVVAPSGSDAVLPALFKSFSIPGEFDGDDLSSIAGMSITVQGHAMQRTGFENDEDGAWAAFDKQLAPSAPTPSPSI